jgi:hypothetical protein
MISEIHFGDKDPPLSYYESVVCKINETRIVEVFPQINFQMKYISVNSPDLSSYLLQIDTNQTISL